MIKQYTNVKFFRGKLHVRGFNENGERVNEIVEFSPTLWVEPTFKYSRWKRYIENVDITNYRDIYGKKMVALTFKNIKGAETFISENSTFNPVTNRQVLSTHIWESPRNRYETQYMCEAFPEEIVPDINKLRIVLFDIETETGHRIVPDNTLVTIRKKNDDEGLTTKISIVDFENMPEQGKYEIYDENSKDWVSYDFHPYKFIGGFPDPEKATEKITLITCKVLNEGLVRTWGMVDFKSNRGDVYYEKCSTEAELLKSFLLWYSGDYPDVFSGYNSASFDNLYLANRIKHVLGEDWSKKLSPYGMIREVERKDPKTHNYVRECEFEGVACLDYLKMYKKWGASGQRESFKLDSVGEDEVGVKKVPNPTGGTFREFYTGIFDVKREPKEDDHEIKKLGWKRTQLKYRLEEEPNLQEEYARLNEEIIKKCQQLFVEYNIRDVELVELINKKLRLFDVCIMMAYSAHENFMNAFSPVQTWDMVIYNNLARKKIVIPHESFGKEKTEKYEGAYVKEPIIGKHEFCLSVDLDSLYPHLIMQYNISPDTVVKAGDGKNLKTRYNVDKLINGIENTEFAKRNGYSVAASGVAFRKDKQGIIPFLCETFYVDRKKNKKTFLRYKSEHEKIVDELRNRGIKFESE